MIKLLELFGGIGSQTQALKNIGIEHKATLCEIDKYAVDVYKQLHGETENLGDITKINPKDLCEGQWDLITYSFPCQSVSIAGKQEGLTRGSGTTSSLLWECEKIIRKVKPKYLLMENVANLLSEQFYPEFEKWLIVLKDLGYTNYYQILNSKDYGIPQNRERVFCVSIRGKHNYYQFPKPMVLDKRLKDILEDAPNEKYYLSKTVQDRFIVKPIGENIIGTTKPENRTIGQRDLCYKEDGVMGALTSTDYKQPKQVAIEQIGTLDIKGNDILKRVYSSEGLSPTLNTMQGGNKQPKIIEMNKEARHQQDLVQHKDGISPTITASMGLGGGHIPMVKQERLTKQAFETLREKPCKDGDVINPFNKRVIDDGICPTITTRPEGFKTANLIVVDEKIKPSVASNFEREKEEIAKSNKDIYQAKCDSGWQDNKIGLKVSPTLRANNSDTFALDNKFRIRKLTPRECWRLMGWSDEQFNKIKGISDAQLYKQAGNSIVVNVLEAIFRSLFLEDSKLPQKIEYIQEKLF